ncbi:MAG TPA: response regulator [Caulobacteraceae bacterium]|nr:response regulator [Caulobacteraceae bacterium]
MTGVDESVHPRPEDGALGLGAALSPSVLIVDDDRTLQGLISDFLQRHGITVYCAASGAGVDALLAVRPVDVVLLDVMLPGEDGLSICRRLAARTEARPAILILSEAADETDRIVGLELGADDYVSKPANLRELLARIRALRRRFTPPATGASLPAGSDDGLYEFSGWTLSVWTHELKTPDGDPVALTSSEFSLLRAFLEHPRRVLTRDQLLNLVRGRESFSFDRAVDVQVSRLRRKLLSADGREGDLVRTVRNEGYMFVSPVKKS